MADRPPPKCFGHLETVFPLCSNGLRESPPACMRCAHKTACLRTAIGKGSGYRVQDEMVDKAYRGGVIGFFQRWSQKKNIHRLKTKHTGK